MRLLRVVTVLALVLSPLYAGYGEKGHWDDLTGYTLGKPTIFDVDGDSVADICLCDSASVSIYSGVSRQIIWTFPFEDPGLFPVVTNTDDDPANELVVSTGMLARMGEQMRWHVGIYDCASHALEMDGPLGYAARTVADVDGDQRADILVEDTLGTTWLWGWVGGGVNENPGSPAPTGLIKASPAPARRSVSFTLPASAGPGSVTITDAAGRTVRTLATPARSGPRQVQWDCLDNSGNQVPAGTYIYRLEETSGKLEVVR